MSQTPTTPTSPATTAYRPLTRGELIAASWQQQRYNDWLAVREYALDYYGPRARYVELKLENEYDDDGHFWDLTGVHVFDAENQPLTIDLSLPKVRAFLGIDPDADAGDPHDAAALYEQWDDEITAGDLWDELPRDHDAGRSDITQEPERYFPVLYVPVEEVDAP